ncbi:NAD-dependent epimerase/dehydratase family protein [Kitasatospora sp. NPDC057904]|uniref:NAD-dependent epimerase/dehydratase family protein n=1 Tax=Kitasatospora sp. NPDC057904 TaxID=3346275 RepID=UPI0036DBB0B0
MRILLLGGTSFIGRTIADEALRSGADVTLFNRGRTNPGLFPAATRLTGDRDTGDYSALRHGGWDAVVDLSGFFPRQVTGAMDVLGDTVGRYLFISSHAVYERAGLAPGSDESTPRRAPLREAEQLDEETYGRLKVACEDEVVARYGERATIVRPGKVAGPHDDQRGLTYWARRAARGGRIALPGRPEQPVQLVDSRDLARFVLRLVQDERPGAFHAVGPAEPVTLGGVIATCAAVAGTEVEVVPVPPETAPPPFFPLVREEGLWPGQQRDASRARAAGLPTTPLAVTAANVLTWDRDRGAPPLGHGFTAEDEARVLSALDQDAR